MLAYATATYEKVISCILCSPLALYIHPVEFVTVSPALFPAPTFHAHLISFCFVSIFHFNVLSNFHANLNQSLFKGERFYPSMSDNPLPFFPSFFLFFLAKCIWKGLKFFVTSCHHLVLFSLRGSRGGQSLLYQWLLGGKGGGVREVRGEVRRFAHVPLSSHVHTVQT